MHHFPHLKNHKEMKTMAFEHFSWIKTYLLNPGTNDAEDMGVVVARVPGAVAQCIGVHVLRPDENTFGHNLLFAYVDASGKRIYPPAAQVAWEWEGMSERQRPPPLYLEKEDWDGPPGNLAINSGMEITAKIGGGVVSDVVSGIHTQHVGTQEEHPNRWGHWSFFVVFQMGGQPTPDPDPVPVPPTEPGDPVDKEKIARAAQAMRHVIAGLAELEDYATKEILELLES